MLLVTATVAGACSPDRDTPADNGLRRDVAALGRHFEDAHADLASLLPPAEWERAVDDLADRSGEMDRDEALVELMRLAALPGRTSGGDGHSGIFPFDDHERELHLLPLRLYDFPDGLYVVDAPGRRELVGARVVSIAGTPVEDVAGLVEPLVPGDNDMTVRARLPQLLVVAEVLAVLGVVDGVGPVEVELDTERGAVVETVEPVAADELAEVFDVWHPMIPPGLPAGGRALYLRRADVEWWSAYLPREDVVFVQYNQTTGDSFALGHRIVRLVRRHDPRGAVEWDESDGSFDEPLLPDFEVEVTAGEYFAGEDPVLARALEVLHRD